MRIGKLLTYVFAVFLLAGSIFAQNPIVQTIYTADPAPMVYNDTLFVYTGHDEDASTYFTMKEWRVYSTVDMVNWTDHGSPLSYKSFSWAKGDAWAGQCIYRNGKFYYYVPIAQKTGGMAIGVAVANHPTGPFEDALGKPLITSGSGDIDPTVFIDNDGQAYLYWGNPYLKYVKLNEDMISYNKAVGIVQVPLTEQGFGKRTGDASRVSLYEEGPWFYKRNGLYYMVFAAGGIPEYISYSTSPNSTGPWTYKGVIMPTQGGSFTNHPGVVDYKGNSYFFYHNGALPGGGGYTRSVCVEQFTYNADGSFPTITMTTGIKTALSNLNPFKINEAETIAQESGIETEKNSNGVINVYAIENNDYIKIRNIDFGDKGASTFTASVSSAALGGSIELHLKSRTGTLVGTLPINYTGGYDTWRTETTSITGAAGVNDLYLVFKGTADTNLFKIDYWKFEPKTDSRTLVAINASVDKYKIDTTSESNTSSLKITAIYSDGSSEDITSAAEITPQQNGIVSIANGMINGISYGAVAIDISFQGKTDVVNMIVKDLKSEVTAKSLSLDKYTIDLTSGNSDNIIVTVEYNDGHTENVTDKATYTNPNSMIATISAGKITAKAKGTVVITISFKGLLGDAVTAQLTINVSNRDPYGRNEAEGFDEQNGIQTESCTDTGGGMDVGFIENGDWLKFNSLDFSFGASSFEARVASSTSGGNIEIRLDNPSGKLVGTCAVTGTGGWQTWATKSCSISGLSGIHNIYLKFTGSSGFLMNINWWKFNPEQTDVDDNSKSGEVPRNFFLEQNFPNPFNPSTVISYRLASNIFVTLKIYDAIGNEVAALVNDDKPAGTHSVEWRPEALASGIYFCRIQAGSFSAVRKIIFMK